MKLGKLLGLADADEATKKAFGDKEKADEMQYKIFRMRQLKKELAEKRAEVIQEVPPTSSCIPPPVRMQSTGHHL